MSSDGRPRTALALAVAQHDHVDIAGSGAFAERSQFFNHRMRGALGERGRTRANAVFWDNEHGISWAQFSATGRDATEMRVQFFIAGVTAGPAHTIQFPTNRLGAVIESLAANKHPSA